MLEKADGSRVPTRDLVRYDEFVLITSAPDLWTDAGSPLQREVADFSAWSRFLPRASHGLVMQGQTGRSNGGRAGETRWDRGMAGEEVRKGSAFRPSGKEGNDEDYFAVIEARRG